MCEEIEYGRLYDTRPTNSEDRMKRAILLIRKGWCNTRAYDDCFEMGDGGFVLALFMDHIRTVAPELRAMMIAQDAWSDEYKSYG